jgi:hypothetical protein
MANSLGQKVWTLDTVGIISLTPVAIARIDFIPAADGNTVLINSHARYSVISGTRKDNVVGTVSGTNTLTSAGNFTADIDDGDILEIIASNGSTNNIGQKLVTGDATTDAVTIAGLTDESTKIYTYQAYKATREFYVVADGTGIHNLWAGEDGIKYLPSFLLETLTAGTLVVYLA